MEIERKFLVGQLPDTSGLKPQKIVQGYISTSPDIRIRQEDEVEYYVTMKGHGDLCREEYTIEITAEEYWKLREKCEGFMIRKVRYCVPLSKGNIAEIDIYTGELSGLNVVEVEFNSETEANDFVPPAWFSTEITYDKAYKNSYLAMNGLPNK